MSKYFASGGPNGRHGDIVWRRVDSGGDAKRYVVDVGDKPIGETWHLHNGWSAIAYAPKKELLGLRAVAGFRNRLAATQYILEVGFQQKEKDL